MIAIPVLSGRINRSGELTLGTLFNLHLARFLASRVHARGVPYDYVFPQGRKNPDDRERPCDLMSRWMLHRDAHCWLAAVPSSEYDLVTHSERINFVQTFARSRSTQVLRWRDFFSLRKLKRDFDDLMEMVPELEMDFDPKGNVRKLPKRN